jgi:peptide chain release factor 2
VVISETNAIKAVLEPFAETERAVEDAGVFLDMADAEPDGPARDEALEEMRQAMERCARVADDLEIRILLSGRFDPNNAYLSLHAGAGGTESCDWADILRRMYGYYAERHGFRMSVLDVQPGEEAGIKSVQLHIEGPYAYGYLKSERGVHRLVRISPYDANKRRHTSFAALDVSAELDEDIEVEILDKDLRVDTYRASGAGGQHVNKTDSAVRLVHLPTGIVVACQAERSQHSNRDKAMKMLKARLYEREQDKQRKEMEQFYGDKGDIAWGRQIRSYVLQPYTMVKDHRTGMETGNVQAVLDGDIDRFVDAWLRQAGGAAS